jgi:hypothetical protein
MKNNFNSQRSDRAKEEECNNKYCMIRQRTEIISTKVMGSGGGKRLQQQTSEIRPRRKLTCVWKMQKTITTVTLMG